MNLKSSPPPSNQTNTFLSLICASPQKQNRGKQKVNLFDMVEERLLFVRNSFIRLSQPLYSDTMVPLHRKVERAPPHFPSWKNGPFSCKRERERERLLPSSVANRSRSNLGSNSADDEEKGRRGRKKPLAVFSKPKDRRQPLTLLRLEERARKK